MNYRFATLARRVLCALVGLLAVHVNPAAQADRSAPAEQAASSFSETAFWEARLLETPILYNFVSPQVFAVAQQGQFRGQNPRAFMLIGDSSIDNGDFLAPFGIAQASCDLGPYAGLAPTISYFTPAPPPDVRGIFTRDSAAVERGLSSSAVFDPFWATDRLCQRGETPLACEARVMRPAAALILIGQADVNFGGADAALFEANMRRMISELSAQGIIPVMTTLVFLPERAEYAAAMRFNGVLLTLAEETGMPLINLWAVMRTLPGWGIGPDRSHLAAQPGTYCDFTGPEAVYGGTQRNLIALQALDSLRRYVLTVDLVP
jgi:hypothetical protein